MAVYSVLDEASALASLPGDVDGYVSVCGYGSLLSEGREIYFQQYGEYTIHKIWRDDALPCRVYLRHCVLAAQSLGDEAYNNFLDHTFIADRETTIRQYFEKMGTSIMEEEPPESLKTRYGG